jgi:hypothetical protein
MLYVIQDAEAQPYQRIRLCFRDGLAGTIDLSDLIAGGGVFGCLADDAVFAQVRIGGNGRWLEWAGDIDLCADALYERIARSHVNSA